MDSKEMDLNVSLSTVLGVLVFHFGVWGLVALAEALS